MLENDYESKQRRLFKKIEELEFEKQQSSISNSFVGNKESIISTSTTGNLH